MSASVVAGLGGAGGFAPLGCLRSLDCGGAVAALMVAGVDVSALMAAGADVFVEPPARTRLRCAPQLGHFEAMVDISQGGSGGFVLKNTTGSRRHGIQEGSFWVEWGENTGEGDVEEKRPYLLLSKTDVTPNGELTPRVHLKNAC